MWHRVCLLRARMELWKAQRAYRQLATKLRRAAPVEEVLHAEEHLLVALGTGERMATELSVLRAAQRSTSSRIRKLRVALANSGLKQQLGRVLEPSALAEALLARGFHELASLVSTVENEVRHFDRRIRELQERITRHEARLAAALENLRGVFMRQGFSPTTTMFVAGHGS